MTRPSPDAIEISGGVAPGFEPVRAAFAENFARRGEVGAACCIYVGGREVVNLAGGRFAPDDVSPYTPDTLQVVASATKGAMAICALRLAERGELDLDAPVATYWPAFAAEGKDHIPVRWLLTHQAGLPCVDDDLSAHQLFSWEPLVAALAAQKPVWEPGSAHGYHALTYGSLVGEVLRRVSGLTPGELVRREIADPLGVEFWVGLPSALLPRVAPLIPSPPNPDGTPDPLMVTLADPTSLAYRTFFTATGFLSMMNDHTLWQAQLPAANGISTARALARMYAACLDTVDGHRLLQPDTVTAAAAPHAEGIDRVLTYPNRFGLGFQLPSDGRPMAGPAGFGHYGLGGSTGFADREHGFAFGYVVNQMLSSSAADPRSGALVQATLACL